MPHAAGLEGTQHRRLRIALHRVQHIARKRRHESARGRVDRRRTQAVHRLLRPLHGDQVIDARQRRCGARGSGGAEGHGSGKRTGSSRNPRRQGDTDACRRRGKTPRATTRRGQTMLRGLRIAANRSANIGGSLTTPAHAWTGPTKRTRYVVAVPLRFSARGSRHVRCVRTASPRGESGKRAYRECDGYEACDDRWCGDCCVISSVPRRPEQRQVLPRDVAAASAVISATS